MESLQNEVLNYIKLIKKVSPYQIEKMYMNGGCYRFYELLKNQFKDAEAYKVIRKGRFVHVITLIDGMFYDVTGLVDLKENEHIEIMEEEDFILAETFIYPAKQDETDKVDIILFTKRKELKNYIKWFNIILPFVMVASYFKDGNFKDTIVMYFFFVALSFAVKWAINSIVLAEANFCPVCGYDLTEI